MPFDQIMQRGATAAGQALIAKQVLPAGSKPLVTTVAKPLFDVALAAGQGFGCFIRASIFCTDGTDMQQFTELIAISVVNKAAAYTSTVTNVAGNGAKAVSAGTLTTSWTVTTGTNKITVNVTPTTSLTPTTFVVEFDIVQLSEQAITLL